VTIHGHPSNAVRWTLATRATHAARCRSAVYALLNRRYHPRDFMRQKGRSYISLLFFGVMSLGAVADGGTPGVWRTYRPLENDSRVVKDRLQPSKNLNDEDDSFLNAVGAVWSYGINRSTMRENPSAGNNASSGFLIDRCHVLTNLHVVYPETSVVDPPLGRHVTFAVGQTPGDQDKGALQGLKTLIGGVVVAHGNATVVDRLISNPEDDWAVIRLSTSVESAITPMSIAAIDPEQLQMHSLLSAAGFPKDHRQLRDEGFKLKDLWGSDGQLVDIGSISAQAAFIQTTIQTTPGESGGPIYGDFNGRRHIVVGMVQGLRGNGIDVSERMPNVQILFTPGALARIAEAQAHPPCDGPPR
jgi:V8-like Glu-specific endopeptidase